VHVAPTASVPEQLFALSAKSAGFVPPSVTLEIVNAAVPLLVSVSDSAAADALTVVFGNASDVTDNVAP
jgi:hypothetical protein